MSSVQISGSASGAGVLNIAAPTTATNRTLTLPDATTTFVGTDVTQTLTNKTLTSPTINTATLVTPTINSAQVATVSGTAPLYMARAWVNFNGSTAVIQASGNVTSVTRASAGNYTINLTTAMPDVNGATMNGGLPNIMSTNFATTSTITVSTASYVGTATDYTIINVGVFR
jgi:hypothetical protein